MRHARTEIELLFEQPERRLIRFRMHLNLPAGQIPRIASDSETLCGFRSEITITDTLNAPTNEVVLCANHLRSAL